MEYIGKQFGEWTVLETSDKPCYYKCKCSCGVIKDVHRSSLKNGKSISCGHIQAEENRLRAERQAQRQFGKRFGRLTIEDYVVENGKGCYICKCDCGNITKASVKMVNSGKTKSCGCYRVDNSKEIIKQNYSRIGIINFKRSV